MKLKLIQVEEEDLESKCSRSCRGNPYDEKCGLINGQYKSYDNWCELDIALCMNPGKDVSYAEVCGMKVRFGLNEHFLNSIRVMASSKSTQLAA